MSRKLTWIRWPLSGGLIAFLVYYADLGHMVEVFRRGDPAFVLLALAIAVADRFLMAYKWTLLARVKGIRMRFRRVLGGYWIATFLGIFLPATVGGDAIRAYAVTRDGHEATDVISSIIVERILGFVALFALVCGGVTLSTVTGQSFFDAIEPLLWSIAALVLVSLALMYLSLKEMLPAWVGRLFGRFGLETGRNRLGVALKRVWESGAGYQHHTGTLILFLALSVLENLFPLFWTYSLAVAFQMEIPLLFFFILVPVVLLLAQLPISLDGFGIHEGVYVYFLGLVGVPSAVAFLLGIASHVVALTAKLPGGILYAWRGLGTGADLTDEAAETDPPVSFWGGRR